MKPGFYQTELAKTTWEIPERYTSLTPVATGAYGSVCAAVDAVSGTKVAIKKLSRPFQTAIHARRTYRELRLLRHMNHENIIDLTDAFSPNESLETLHDVYFVSALMGADLANILKIQRLSDDHVRFLVYQIFRGLKYLHAAGIIHRDLKPGNIAVNEDCELKILDFGLARQADDEMTGYVATRWYRAPEIMLNWMHYNEKVDVWSVGCIMAELLTGKTLFAGTDYIDQLQRIMAVVGTPNDALLAKIQSDDARSYIRSLPVMQKKDFSQYFQGAHPDAVDLLERTLNLDPDQRISVNDAIEHPYLATYHDADDEPVAQPIDLSFDRSDASLQQWKVGVSELVWNELVEYRNSVEHQQMNAG